MTHTRYHDIVLLLLRLMFGLSMAYAHGWPKLQRLTGGEEVKFLDFLGLGPEISLGLAVFAELFCALLLAVGLFTRLAAIPLIITMFVAVFVAHWGDGYADMEGGLLFLVPYVCILLAGPGWYSIDAQIRKSA
ncbi:MAG: DoxX family protein [Phaeodactylibacter sp.]|uniref:DoxX family protein n=1 Tax=Phaeodactylibacter sp. TaxID=1940289 RepID=UPI0032EA9C97